MFGFCLYWLVVVGGYDGLFGVCDFDVFVEGVAEGVWVPLGDVGKNHIVQIVDGVVFANRICKVGAYHHFGHPEPCLGGVGEGAFVLVLAVVVVA